MPSVTEPKKYWRSLEELQDTPEFREMLHREFPVAASEFPSGFSRRRWIQLMGAALSLGGAGRLPLAGRPRSPVRRAA